jgi:arylsulfotransferase ASST
MNHMKYKTLIIILTYLFLSIVFVQAQDELVYGVTIHEESATDGYILFAPVIGKSAYLIDYDGRVIRQWDSDYNILATYLLENGNVVMSVIKRMSAGATGRIEEYDWEGNLVWEFEYPDLHHDIEVLPNGNILMLAWERFPREDILAMGLNPDLLPPDETPDNLEPFDGLFLDTVIEVNPDTDEIVWRWAVSDHLIQDYDSASPNYGMIADFPERINLNFAWQRLPVDRVHFNSVDYNAERDEIVLSAHYYSEIWVIDRSLSTEQAATNLGDLRFRWGNPQTYGYGTEDERQLYLQHDAQWLSDEQIMIFNNGQRGSRPFSTVNIIDLPLDEAGNYQAVTESGFAPDASLLLYRADPPNDFYAMALSGADLLPEQHLFITAGPEGRLFEVNEDGEIVWEYLNPIFRINDATTRSPIFKARYYAADYAAFFGRDMQPTDVIPLQILE